MIDMYIGLMSGTSLDGVDGVLVAFSGSTLRVVASAGQSFDSCFKAELLALNSPTSNELHRAAVVSNQIAAAYATVVTELCQQAAVQGIAPTQICAIGAHGQTVRHQPQRTSESAAGFGYTLQLINPAVLAELTGISVVADFRSRDIAAGGQGAPLVPAFHRQVFGQKDATVAVLNLGGIANLSVLPADPKAPVLGFDCGPANALLDAWCERHTGAPFDAAGSWGAGGHCLPDLLNLLRSEPYFAQPPPKSTGRDLFSMAWLEKKLHSHLDAPPKDIQKTLIKLTSSTCADCVRSYAKDSKILIICGGGAYNEALMQNLQDDLPDLQIGSSAQHGLPPLQVEAAAFAWLARQTILRQPGNLPSATGAAGPRILGAIYPA